MEYAPCLFAKGANWRFTEKEGMNWEDWLS